MQGRSRGWPVEANRGDPERGLIHGACEQRGECGDLSCIRSGDTTPLGDGTERAEQWPIGSQRGATALRRRSEGLYVDDGWATGLGRKPPWRLSLSIELGRERG